MTREEILVSHYHYIEKMYPFIFWYGFLGLSIFICAHGVYRHRKTSRQNLAYSYKLCIQPRIVLEIMQKLCSVS